MEDLQEELEEKILERICLIQANIKNNTFEFEGDGSFKLKLELLDNEIKEIRAKIIDAYGYV